MILRPTPLPVLIPPVGLRESRAPHYVTTHAANASEAIQLELTAMQAMAEALAAIPDEQARDRVLAWLNNAFSRGQVVNPHPTQPTPAPTPRSQPARAPSLRSRTSEPGLSLEDVESFVESFFEDGRPSPGQFPPSPIVAPRPPPGLWARMRVRFRRWR